MQAYAQVNASKSLPRNRYSLSVIAKTCGFPFQVFNKLIRRYKYLEKGFEDEIKKVCSRNFVGKCKLLQLSVCNFI